MLAGSGRLSYSPPCNSVMASIPCTSATHLCFTFTPKPTNSQTSVRKFNTHFLGIRKNLGCFRPSNMGPSNGYRAKCWFKFGKNGVDAEGAGIYGSQSRDDFDRDDVEQVLYLFTLYLDSVLAASACLNFGKQKTKQKNCLFVYLFIIIFIGTIKLCFRRNMNLFQLSKKKKKKK